MKSKEVLITTAMLLLITYTLSLSLVSQAFPATQAKKTLSSTGTIEIQTTPGLGVYSDSWCTKELTAIPWGTLEPGATQNVVCYIKNEGNTPTTLQLQTSNWNPIAASDYINLSWNYNNQAINPNNSIPITLTLSVDNAITGITTFAFQITIVGS